MALLPLLFLLSIGGAFSASALSFCHNDSALFLYDIQSQCPVSISPNPPLQVFWASNRSVELGLSTTTSRRRRLTWRIKIKPKLKILKMSSPKKFFVWLRDAYLKMMLRFANSRVIEQAQAQSILSIITGHMFHLHNSLFEHIHEYTSLTVDGNFLDRALTSKQRNAYTSVLFYAPWCPFSCSMLPKFEILSSMFPQIEHLVVEQSSALPRYGIHNLPSILIVNQRSKVRYSGPKNLQSLAQFYKKTTGLEPVQYFTRDDSTSTEGQEKSILQPWKGPFSEEIIKREPYLALATLFLCLRVLLYASPKVLSHVKALYVSYIPNFNMEIFGGTSQIFGRILYLIDVRRIWTKLRLFKTRNFHERAKNCRVWASSLASVSLGESSSSARSQS
ncbi:hypothetical protein SADUNF_Sadunf13G0047800 [Salix dunnii]|uniref:Thioredoxin domain-containing protein n=1 Tax=Salix dunnii TaxID=1413687 RepID=A0A835JNH8_9ROSI|nr:hypothetical protein SADUNF_Sadunf13G0047800 [Salix dunnii]